MKDLTSGWLLSLGKIYTKIWCNEYKPTFIFLQTTQSKFNKK